MAMLTVFEMAPPIVSVSGMVFPTGAFSGILTLIW
jgi:hypothetical protein